MAPVPNFVTFFSRYPSMLLTLISFVMFNGILRISSYNIYYIYINISIVDYIDSFQGEKLLYRRELNTYVLGGRDFGFIIEKFD